MGRMQADEMARELPLDAALHWHLTCNHYPPLPVALVEPCKAAIEAGQDEDWLRPIPMPEGFRQHVTAGDLIEGLHLESFLE